MLIPLPIGLWVFSLVSDIIYVAGWGGPVWNDVAYYTMFGGVVGGLLAALPGFIDYFSITDDRTRRTGTKHMIANLTIVALYVVNLVIRGDRPDNATGPFILSLVSVGLLVYSGWLGADMVYEHGMGVELDRDGKLAKGRERPYDDHVHVPPPRTAGH